MRFKLPQIICTWLWFCLICNLFFAIFGTAILDPERYSYLDFQCKQSLLIYCSAIGLLRQQKSGLYLLPVSMAMIAIWCGFATHSLMQGLLSALNPFTLITLAVIYPNRHLLK